jgi:hypothetical protein
MPDSERGGRAADEESTRQYRVEASERGDDLLQRYLPWERPARFDSLPHFEQAWRGRLFLMTWAFTGSAAYAWAASGVTDPAEVAKSIELVAGVPDARIEEELIRAEGQRSGVIFMALGEPKDRQ